MILILCLSVTFLLSLYLVYLLNKELSNKYSWQKQVIYRDHLDSEEIDLIISSDSCTVSSFNKDNQIDKICLSFEETLENLTKNTIPFKTNLFSYVRKFLEDKNIFVALSVFNTESIRIFNNEFKLEGPSFFIEKNIYNIYIQYEIFRNNESNSIAISSESDYINFVKDLYEYKNDFTCKVNYAVYKQINKDEKGQKICTLSLITKIGPSYSYVNYRKPFLIDVRNFSNF